MSDRATLLSAALGFSASIVLFFSTYGFQSFEGSSFYSDEIARSNERIKAKNKARKIGQLVGLGLLCLSFAVQFVAALWPWPINMMSESAIQMRSLLQKTAIPVGVLDEHNGAITAVFTALLTLVTGGLVWTGYRQIMTTRAQLRAYVLASGTVVTNVGQGTGTPEAHVLIKNSGQTPAYHVLSVNGFAIDSYPSTPDLVVTDRAFANASLSRVVLGPGDTSVSAVSSPRGPLTPEQRASLANGTGIIYVYGEIRYRDAFGRKQRTKYRYMMGGPVGLRGDQMAACEEGNEAT